MIRFSELKKGQIFYGWKDLLVGGPMKWCMFEKMDDAKAAIIMDGRPIGEFDIKPDAKVVLESRMSHGQRS